MSINKINKKILIKLFLIFSFTICWFSISTTFNDLLILQKNKVGLIEVVNFSRHSLIYLCFFSIIGIILLAKIKFGFYNNLTYFFLILYFLFQINGLIITSNSFENISFIISSLTIILTIILIDFFFSNQEKKVFIFISFLILSMVFVLTFFNLISEYLEGKSNLYGHFTENNEFFFNKDSPRSSGIARSCLVLLLILFVIKKMIVKKNFIIEVFKIFFLSVILLYQSRLIILLTIISLILIFIHENKFNLKNLLKFLSIYFVIPLIFSSSVMFYNSEKRYEFRLNEAISEVESVDRFEKKYVYIQIDKSLPLRRFDTFSSGRFDDWQKIFDKIKFKSLLLGYGSQADRYLINQSASNGLIYALISSGILGFIFYVFFSLMILVRLIKNFLNIKNNNYLNFYSSLIVMILLLRSILETSYAVFSIDLIILLTFLSVINVFKKKKLLK